MEKNDKLEELGKRIERITTVWQTLRNLQFIIPSCLAIVAAVCTPLLFPDLQSDKGILIGMMTLFAFTSFIVGFIVMFTVEDVLESHRKTLQAQRSNLCYEEGLQALREEYAQRGEHFPFPLSDSSAD